MRQLPILFSTEMVQAILDGRKTVTRRAVNPQPEDHHWDGVGGYKHHMNLIECQGGQFLHSFHSLGGHIDTSEECDQRILCPYGRSGGLLYVRETWAEVEDIKGNSFIAFKADWKDMKDDFEGDLRWKPSIHMKKDYARIWLKVKEVRVERLQDISEEDIKSEGVEIIGGWDSSDVIYAKWIELWDSINAKRGFGWDVNPFVWVVSFEVISTNGKPSGLL